MSSALKSGILKDTTTNNKTATEDEIQLLRQQLRGMEIILQQNAALEKEVERLCAELDEASNGIHKKGYLYKFREREIYFQPKWGSRYFVLQGYQLSYYGDEQELRPRRTITLSKCYVKEEGVKKGGLYHVFAIYLSADDSLLEDTLLLKLSCENAAESKQWVELLHQACALADEQFAAEEEIRSTKAMEENEEDETTTSSVGMVLSPSRNGISFLNQQEIDSESSQSVVSPSVLPSSTENSSQQLDPTTPLSPGGGGILSNTSGWSETGHVELDIGQEQEALYHPVMLTRVRSASKALQKSMSRQLLSKRLLPKYNQQTNEMTVSGTRLSGLDSTTTVTVTATSTTSTKVTQKPKSFPGYKPMHTTAAPSPLSGESRPGEYSFRGFFNLGVIILMLTHCDLIVNNLMKYGFKFDLLSFVLPPAITATATNAVDIQDAHQHSLLEVLIIPLCIAMLFWTTSITSSYCLEVLAMRYHDIPETVIRVINVIFGVMNFVLPCAFVWTNHLHPGLNMLLLFQSIIIWMKLISYAHANKDLRVLQKRLKQITTNSSTNSFTSSNSLKLASSDELSAFVDSSTTKANLDSNQYARSLSAVKDIEPPFLSYPQNITYSNLCYFLIAPTLCYQLNYPRIPKINWQKIVFLVARMIFVTLAILFSVEQYIAPTLEAVIIPMDKRNIPMILERLLKLSIPNTYVWLLGFYLYFHLWLNFLAEITRFGDRMFYKDWWNAKTIDRYWRTWNLPVHHWVTRHLYHPLLRAGFGKIAATFVVFSFSAVMHEVIISLPFQHISMHAFLGMFAQAPLIFIAKYVDRTFDNAFIGNAIFWVTFCIVGQPMGVMLYYYDLCKLSMAAAPTAVSTLANVTASAIAGEL